MTYPTPSPSFFKTDLKAEQTQFPALTMYLMPTSLFKILLMPLLQFFLSARIAASVLSVFLFCHALFYTYSSFVGTDDASRDALRHYHLMIFETNVDFVIFVLFSFRDHFDC